MATKEIIKKIYRQKNNFGLGATIKNPLVVGALAGAARNVMTGKSAVDFKDITKRCSTMNQTNPLIFLAAGFLLKSDLLKAIGSFLVVDPPPEQPELNNDNIKAGDQAENTQQQGDFIYSH
ncbi:MAG: hypothetical protein BWK75_04680 [Candidatus Altiarchaeales archaeon A3]|nr:MAG: hypothetical protein BWK75_04680 [Candidatus Altiarchaeales archaeon A3]